MAFKIVGKIKIDTRKVSAALARYCAASEKEFELLERARNPQDLEDALLAVALEEGRWRDVAADV